MYYYMLVRGKRFLNFLKQIRLFCTEMLYVLQVKFAPVALTKHCKSKTLHILPR